MTLIDQRILIPAPIQTVWQIIADHHQLPKWRSDVTAVSILTTKSDTVGARRRITPTGSHKDIIEEISAWYAGVGYEYNLIQGSTFKNFISRVRLQSTPDGTIVQWTIAYDIGGLLKRFFTGRQRRKRLENITATSLRQLRRHVEQLGITLDQNYRDRRSIQKAPDAQFRADYGAKLFAQAEQSPAIQSQSDSLAQTLAAEEPPVRIEDTPSVPKVPPPSFIAEALTTPLAGESNEEIPTSEPLVSQEDTKPTSPVILDREPPDDTSFDEATDNMPDDVAALSPQIEKASVNDKVATKPKRPAGLNKAITNKPATKLTDEDTDPSRQSIRSDLPPPTAKRDTGEISIWDAFGVNRPKDELTATIDELLKTSDSEGQPSKDQTSGDGVADATSLSTKLPLEEWLAATEPPLPSSASESVRTLARPPRKATRGLRRIQKQSRHAVRRPKRPTDGANPK